MEQLQRPRYRPHLVALSLHPMWKRIRTRESASKHRPIRTLPSLQAWITTAPPIDSKQAAAGNHRDEIHPVRHIRTRNRRILRLSIYGMDRCNHWKGRRLLGEMHGLLFQDGIPKDAAPNDRKRLCRQSSLPRLRQALQRPSDCRRLHLPRRFPCAAPPPLRRNARGNQIAHKIKNPPTTTSPAGFSFFKNNYNNPR